MLELKLKQEIPLQTFNTVTNQTYKVLMHENEKQAVFETLRFPVAPQVLDVSPGPFEYKIIY